VIAASPVIAKPVHDTFVGGESTMKKFGGILVSLFVLAAANLAVAQAPPG
jgi:hypothetical protein